MFIEVYKIKFKTENISDCLIFYIVLSLELHESKKVGQECHILYEELLTFDNFSTVWWTWCVKINKLYAVFEWNKWWFKNNTLNLIRIVLVWHTFIKNDAYTLNVVIIYSFIW